MEVSFLHFSAIILLLPSPSPASGWVHNKPWTLCIPSHWLWCTPYILLTFDIEIDLPQSPPRPPPNPTTFLFSGHTPRPSNSRPLIRCLSQGPTVNLASRLESSGLPNEIQVSTDTKHLISDTIPQRPLLTSLGVRRQGRQDRPSDDNTGEKGWCFFVLIPLSNLQWGHLTPTSLQRFESWEMLWRNSILFLFLYLFYKNWRSKEVFVGQIVLLCKVFF